VLQFRKRQAPLRGFDGADLHRRHRRMTARHPAPDSAPPEAPLPRIFAGRYRLVAELVGGGMATAYRGWDDDAGRLVVVKIPRPAATGDGDALVRFDREVRTAAALDHPHIVPVLDFGVADERPFMVMPYLAGGSLAARLPRNQNGDRQPLSAATLHAWLPAIAEALDHAHAEGVLHRDMKPANVFFDAFGGAHLGDFGIAKFLEERDRAEADAGLTRTNLALGTDYYMAPERFAPKPVLDGSSDQYSLAVSVYEILAGSRPFQGTSDHIVVEHCTAAVPPLPEGAGGRLPESLRAAVTRGLAKKPADRFPSCRAFAEAVLAEVPAPAAEESAVTVACPRCSRLLRLPLSAAGGRGTCRKCRVPLTIGADGSAVWPADEDLPRVEAVAPGKSAPTSWAKPRWRWPTAVAAALAATGIAAAIIWAFQVKQPGLLFDADSPQVAVVEPSPAEPPPVPKADQAEQEPVSPETVAAETEMVNPLPTEVADDPAADPRADDPPMPAVVAPDTQPPSQDEIDRVAGSEPAGPMQPPETPAGEAPAAAPPAVVAAVAPPAEPAAPTEPSPPTQPVAQLLDDMHWILVGDPGNAPDANGLGAVAPTFLIGRYELTNDEYSRFLNGSSAGKSNRHGVADGPTTPAEGAATAAILRLGNEGELRYEVVDGKGLLPVVGLRWSDAARLANWLHNGGGPESDTESGAYSLADHAPDRETALAPDPGAKVWIPSLDEWYKAAYYKGGSGDAGYWRYPTGAGSPPKACAADDQGFGVPDGKSANFTRRSRWAGAKPLEQGGCLTAVGSNGPPGPCGAFDMGGNAAELVTVPGREPTAPAHAGLCGGDAGSKSAAALASEAQASPPPAGTGGLRLAMVSPSGDFVARPPLEHARVVEVPRPIRAAVESLQAILGRVAEVRREQATAEFFTAESAQANAIRDLGLTAAVRGYRDEVKSLLAEAKTEAEKHLRAVAQLRETSDALRKLGLAQGVDGLMAADLRLLEADYEAALEPCRARAAELGRKAGGFLLPAAGK
jgi:eukaryotic-like serine/threonine-protein kinase